MVGGCGVESITSMAACLVPPCLGHRRRACCTLPSIGLFGRRICRIKMNIALPRHLSIAQGTNVEPRPQFVERQWARRRPSASRQGRCLSGSHVIHSGQGGRHGALRQQAHQTIDAHGPERHVVAEPRQALLLDHRRGRAALFKVFGRQPREEIVADERGP